MKASDGDAASAWKPSADDKEPWWQLDMEFEFRLDRVEAKAAGNWKGQPPVVQVSRDGNTWKDVKTVLNKDGTGLTAACPEDAELGMSASGCRRGRGLRKWPYGRRMPHEGSRSSGAGGFFRLLRDPEPPESSSARWRRSLSQYASRLLISRSKPRSGGL